MKYLLLNHIICMESILWYLNRCVRGFGTANKHRLWEVSFFRNPNRLISPLHCFFIVDVRRTIRVDAFCYNQGEDADLLEDARWSWEISRNDLRTRCECSGRTFLRLPTVLLPIGFDFQKVWQLQLTWGASLHARENDVLLITLLHKCFLN